MARQRHGNLIGLDVGPYSVDRIRDVIEVYDVPVYDGVGLKILMRDMNKLEPVAFQYPARAAFAACSMNLSGD